MTGFTIFQRSFPLRSTRPFVRRILRAAFVFSTLAAGGSQGAEPLPVSEFFRRPDFEDMVMSPNGERVAATVLGKSGRVALVILDPRDLSRSRSIARYEDADIAGVRWVNDTRLLFRLNDRQLVALEQPRGGWLSIDVEGKEQPVPFAGGRLRSLLRDGSEDVLVERNVYFATGEWRDSHIARVNARTGARIDLSPGEPDHVTSRAFDSTGTTRALVTSWGGKQALYWKPVAGQPWKLVSEFEAYRSGGPPRLLMIDRQDRLFIVGRATSEMDTEALLRVDMREPDFKAEVVLALDGYDFNGYLVTDGLGTVLGVRYLNDAQGTHWFDARMARIQKQVDALLPATNNMIDCGRCDDPQQVLVKSVSDRQPMVFTLLDVKTGSLKALASSRPWIKPAAMARRDLVRIAARDGLAIPVHVTRPLGQQGAAPMVVLVHGGPWVRGGEWAWENQSQFLASRGYVVIEPEFRGSTGFGDKLYRAGFKQWGLAMQDDIADATQWAIKQAYADPRRICIAGASYGGYATLMGLVRHPELYRCGVQWVGVTDIELMYSVHWSDFSQSYKTHGMPVLVGDRVKDAEQFAATSPIKLANKLKQPLLMAYGELDVRVPLVHGEKMRSALSAAGNPPEWIVYDGEGHGWAKQANDIDFWTRVERFLELNLRGSP